MSDAPSSPSPHAFSRLAEGLIGDLRGLAYEAPKGQVKRPNKALSELIESILEKYQIGRDAPEHVLRDQWASLVGPANAHFSHPLTIDPTGQLLVLVNHAVVRNELFLHRETILKRIRATPGCAGIKRLHFRMG